MIHDDVDEETTESEAEEDVERILYKWFNERPAAFDKEARKRKDRDQLKQETHWTDEQLEGWKSMINRDASILRKLERKFERQGSKLQSTRWKPSDNEADRSLDPPTGRGRGSGPRRGKRDSSATRGRQRGYGRAQRRAKK